ncbi:hypothetical protein ES707_05429 [subsurface metagenome]
MARKRTLDIHELVFDPELVRALKSKGLIFYEVLWGNADDFGGFEMNYEKIKLWCGALPITITEVKKYLKILTELRKIILYETDGKKCGWLKNLMKCQPLKNPSLPTLPLPEWITYEIKKYPSGKKYAQYQIITKKLPVAYQYATKTTETIPKETILKEFLEYFNLKTGKKLILTDVRRTLIEQRLKTHTLDQLKIAVDNFILDPWEDRHKYIDVVYCIGVRSKVDNLEKWLNWSFDKKPDPITVSAAISLIQRNQTTSTMEEILNRLPEKDLSEFMIFVNKDNYLKGIYQRAKKEKK